jgi:hypothetical protein
MFSPLPVPMAARITKYLNKYVRRSICLIYMSSFYFWSPPLARKMPDIIHVCQAILETGSERKLSHNGCTAGNFDLPDHGFLLLNCSTGHMECSTGNSYQAEALTNVLRYHTNKTVYICFHSLPVPMAARITKYVNKYVRRGICLIYMSSFYFWSPPLARKMRKTNVLYYPEYPSGSGHPILAP